MELRQTLIAISNDARGWLRAWSRDFTEREAGECGAGEGRPNPLAWQLGHLACVEDDVGLLFGYGEAPLVPPGLRAICATGGPSPAPGTTYPPLTELWELLNRTHERLLGLVDSAALDDLDRAPAHPQHVLHLAGAGRLRIGASRELPRGRDRRAPEGAGQAADRLAEMAMQRVTGIGGIFFKARDAQRFREWWEPPRV